MAQTVPRNVHPTVNLTPVDTQTDRVQLVLEVMRVITALQVLSAHNVLFSQIRVC